MTTQPTLTDTDRLDWLLPMLIADDGDAVAEHRTALLYAAACAGLTGRAAVDTAMLADDDFQPALHLTPPEACCPAAPTGDLPIDHPSNAWVRAAIEAGRGAYYRGEVFMAPTSAHSSIAALAYVAEEATRLRVRLDNAIRDRTQAEAALEKAEASLGRYRRMAYIVRGATGHLSTAIELLDEDREP